MTKDLKALINTVQGVNTDVATLKPLIEMVDDLSKKYKDMEKRLSAVENNPNKNEILDEVKSLLNKREAEERHIGRKKSCCP